MLRALNHLCTGNHKVKIMRAGLILLCPHICFFFVTMTKCLEGAAKGRKDLLHLISNKINSIMVARKIHTGSLL